jgi:hypothetical protein
VIGADQIMRLTAGQMKTRRIANRIDQRWIWVLNPPRDRPIARSSWAFLRRRY